MDGLLILGGLFFLLVVPVLAISASVQVNGLRREIVALKETLVTLQRRLSALERSPAQPAEPEVAAVAAAPAPEPEPVAPEAPATAAIEAAPPQETVAATPMASAPPPRNAPKKIDFELKLGGRVFVWLGAVMLALAGAFLVKYSIDVGLLSPGVRVGLGILLGILLLGGGQWLRKDSPVIAQALAAAAVADWFASLFAAVALYHLIDPVVGFVALAMVTAIGILLALREGPFVGLVGIAGGFITPAIVATGTPRPGVLFTYLYLIQLGALVLQHKRGWWHLAVVGIGGGLLWVLGWAGFDRLGSGEGSLRLAVVSVPLFLLATDLTQLWSLYGKGGVAVSREMALTARVASLACFLLMAVWLATGGYKLMDWGFLIALVLAHLAAARRFPKEEVSALVGAAIAVAVYAAWSPFGYDWIFGQSIDRRGDLILIGLLLGAAFGLGGFWFELGAERPTRWAGLSTLGTAFLFGGAYLNLNEADLLLTWPIQAVILAALHMGAAERLNRFRQRGDGRYDGALGLHCLAVSGFLALAVPMRLETEWISAAWSIELPVMAWVALQLNLSWLKRGIWAGGVLILLAILGSGFPTGEGLIFNWLLYGIGLPCLCFIVTAQLLKRHPGDRPTDRETHILVSALELGGGALLALLVGMEIDHVIGRTVLDSGADFLRAGIMTIAWAVLALGLFRLYRRSQPRDQALLYGALGFVGLACLTLVVGGFILFNPLVDAIDVGTTWVFNRLLVVYAVPATLLLLVADRLRTEEDLRRFGAWPAQAVGLLALVTGFVWITLAIRQVAHGAVFDTGDITDAEQYGYSAAWTLYGLALLGLGTWKRSQVLRYASAVVVLITVCKVFLVDAANLTGLYRVASFLGLGLSLIGIGYLYQRLLFKK